MTRRTPTPQQGLKFYPKSHRYKLDGRWVPGVTTILGILDKPALKKWAATQVAEWVADHPDEVDRLRGMGRLPMVAALKEVPWQKRDDAADRGSTLHAHAEGLLRGEEVEVEDEYVPVMENALRFLDDWQIDPVLVEVACASREHQWAGTADLFARYRHPRTGHRGMGIFDWKSGKALYPEYAWQLNAYAFAEFHGLDGDEGPVPPCDAAFGVQIRADGYDVAPFAFGPHIYDEFLTIRRTYDIAKNGRGDWRTPGTGHMGLLIQPPEEIA